MGFDTMRMNSGRCPPFLVAGLLVMCVLLTCNWWTLSSQNYDILKELEEMGEQFRKCSSQRSLCESERSIAESRLQAAESAAGTTRAKLSQEISTLNEQLNDKDNEIKELTTANENSVASIKTCESELENVKQLDESRASVLALLRLEKTATEQQLREQKDKVAELQKKLDELDAKVVTNAKTVKPDAPVKSVSPRGTISPNLAQPDLKLDAADEEEKSNGGDERFDTNPETPDPQNTLSNPNAQS